MDNRHSVSFCRRFLSYAICAVIAGQPLLPAIGAAITPSGNAQMEQADNGVPVVNITTPNGAGISHNQYGDYNVGKGGLILNNATGKLNQTQLGGLIQNNPNLKAGQEARGIINEVTGGKRSELKGYTEVAGKAANVMVANPYGITCDGCGFINTPQATLTTGKPVMSADGSLQALEVTKGSITINGAGLDASQSDAVSIIARATDINAQLHAKDLTVTTGANRVGADGSITPIKGEGVAPTVAIDTSALGGMYANRIRLASTERGVGVNLGNLNARQGDITLNAAGKLVLKDSLATGNTTITATDVTLSGDNKTSGNLNVTGTNALMLNQTRLVADKHLTLSSSGLIAQNGGELTAGQNITLSGHALNQDNSGKTNASGNVTLSATGNAMMKGNTVAGNSLVVNTGSLSNSGILAAGTDAHVRTGELTHSGTLQGNTLNVIATDLTSTGGLKAGRSLDISARDITLSGQTISGDSLILKGNTLKTTATAQTQGNSVSVEVQNAQFDGTQAARDSLAIKTRGRLTHGGITQAQTLKTENDSFSNSGLLLATGDIHVLTQSVANTGTVAGNVLFINAEHINNNGLLQGDDSLNLTGRALDLQAGSRTLTNGILSLSGTTLTSAGQIQGNGISVNAHDWQQGGSLLATGALLASVTGTLNNTGELLSQNNATLNVAHIISSGRLLSAGDLAVTGNTLHNSGTVQGNNVALYQDRITNNGAITGVAALTLATRPDMASPFLSLVNNAKGSLLTAGDLSVTAGELNNTGQWQGKRVLVHAQKLTNSGALQAAELLDAQISNNLTGVTGSKITSNGEMALSALTLTNGGQWIAKNLALNANALTNSGEITGVDALSATLKQSLNNQTGGKLLSGGSLNLSAGSTTNAGQVRGASLTMNVSGELGNTAGAVLLSQDTLKLSSATLSNQGTIQGGGESSVEARTRIQNDGKLISGGKLTLGAPELMNNSNGLMQAVTLLLDVVNTVNGGRVLTSDRAELKGTTLTNNGTLQGADLLVNYRSFTSSGTALGTASLTVKGDSLSHTDSGKLYSAGNLLLDVRDFSGRGLVVALGDTTLKLINALSNNATLAAGKTLSVTSQNAVTNNRLMQGNSIVLNAGGEFVNNAQLTLGSGNSTFSAQHILQNTPGSLRAGGDVYLASRGNITVNGFTGTAGSLTMSAAGTLLNSTLIYAGHNLSLFADRIHNIYGDILAGNNLWMQRDAVGNANRQVVNTSGNIETQKGDITVKTASLLNHREGLTATTTENVASAAEPKIAVNIDDMPEGSVGVYYDSRTFHGGGGCAEGLCITYYKFYYAPFEDYLSRKFILSESATHVTSQGGAGRIASGRDISINAASLNNEASVILANRDIQLSGGDFNNQSWQDGTTKEYLIYSFDGKVATDSVSYMDNLSSRGGVDVEVTRPGSDSLTFSVTGHNTESQPGAIYRAIISAGGNLSANFTNNIGNTTVTANAGGISNTINAPSLNTLTPQGIGNSFSGESLAAVDNTGIRGPGGLSDIADGLVAISGANSSLYPLPSGNNGYFVPSTDPDSPYLITVNPKLEGLGNVDSSLFNGLYGLLGMTPGQAPHADARWSDEKTFLGSAYFLDRLGLRPEKDYRFLGDAVFDTRYVSNALLNQTGSRYIKGLGSDLEQMQYLMDSAASQQKGLGLTFGVSLTAEQVASLSGSILWWESATLNGQTVMVPKLYLSPKDITLNHGGVISGNNVQLAAGNITNSAGTLTAQNGLALDSASSIDNLNAGLINAGGSLNLSAVGDINNVGSAIAGKAVALESITGSINNITQTQKWGGSDARTHLSGTDTGSTATITASDSLSLDAGRNINITGAEVTSGGSLGMFAGNDISIAANEITASDSHRNRKNREVSSSATSHQGSTVSAGKSVMMAADNNLNIIASDISAQDNALLSAGNDLNLNAARENESHRNGKSESHESHAAVSTVTAGKNLTLTAGRDVNSQAASVAAENNVAVQAGRDVNLMAESASEGNSYRSKNKKEINESVRQQGSEITAGEHLAVVAGRDVTAQAADVYATGKTAVVAGRDITLSTSTESDYEYLEKKKTSGGMFSKKTTHTLHEESHSREKGTQLSGESVILSAGNDLMLQGSSVAAERGVALTAGNNVTVEAATNTDTFYDMKKTKKSGVFSSGSGFGVTIGSQSSKNTRKGAETTQSDARSMVGTSGGNVIISAGNQVTLSAADVMAGRAKDDTTRATGHIDITGSDIVIIPGRDTVTESAKHESKSSGITVSVKAPFEDTVRNVRDTVRGKDGSGKNSTVDKVKSLSAEGAALASDGPGQMAAVSAGRSKSSAESHYQGEFNSGSSLAAAGNIQMTATGKQGGSNSGNILIAGSQINAGEAVLLDAKRDVDITTSTDREAYSSRSKSSGWNVTSEMPTAGSATRATQGGGKHGSQLLPGGMKQSEDSNRGTRTTENASVIQGSDIYVNSREGSVNISGSQLTATEDLMLAAVKGNITVTAGRDTSQNDVRGSSKTIGTLGGDGYSATAGYSREKHSSKEGATTEFGQRSQLTSQTGNIIAQAGGDLSLSGTDVRAGQSVSLSGENVLFDVSRDTRDGEAHSNSSQYGVTAAAGGWAVDAAKAAESTARSVEDGDDARLTAIRTGQAGMTAAQGMMTDSAVVKGKVSVTVGSSSQDNSYHVTNTHGTTVNAGESVVINARNDIVGQGVQIGGKKVVLDAGRDILLTASQNTQNSQSKNSGSQFSAGVGVSLIGSQNGISIELGASQQKGKENSQSLSNTNSVIRAEDQLTISSGRDTTLNGAELEGHRVVMNTGRDLTISSVQDTASYDSRQSSSGVGLSLCIPPICYGASSGSVSASGENVTQSGRSVTDQSGIRAGDGGFDIRVGNHTQLDGAVIASKADSDKNRLETGTLGWRDIHNESKTSGDSYTVAVSGSAGGSGSGENRNVSPAIGTGHAERNISGTTSSAISNGSIIIRDPANEQQDIAGLSRDTENIHRGVDVTGDVQKVKDNLAVQSEGSVLAASALDVYGKYAERKAKESNAALKEKLAAEGKLTGDMTAEEREARLKADPDYQVTDYGPGSEFWTKGSAAAGLLAGALGGNLKAGAAAGAAPLLASLVRKVDEASARAALHGIVAAALTKVSGGRGSEEMKAGAAGAITGSGMTEHLISALYGNRTASELTADEKRLVSSLVTIAGGLAGAGVSGGNLSMAALASNTARVEVENNSLSDLHEQLVTGESQIDKFKKQLKIDEEKFSQENCAGISAEACTVKFYEHRRTELNGITSTTADFLPVVGDFKSYAEAEDWIDYTLATVGLIPGADFVTKPLKEAKQLLKAGDLNGANKLLQETSDQISSVTRPGHRQSEIDVGNDLGDGWKEQVSYKDGKEVPYGTKGSTRPDWCNGYVCSLEVKNYNIATNQSGLINNVAKQAIERQKHLPEGMMQEIVIDVRGQVLSLAQEDAIVRGIVQKSNGIVKPTDIQFKR